MYALVCSTACAVRARLPTLHFVHNKKLVENCDHLCCKIVVDSRLNESLVQLRCAPLALGKTRVL